jgi:hypothetical protein
VKGCSIRFARMTSPGYSASSSSVRTPPPFVGRYMNDRSPKLVVILTVSFGIERKGYNFVETSETVPTDTPFSVKTMFLFFQSYPQPMVSRIPYGWRLLMLINDLPGTYLYPSEPKWHSGILRMPLSRMRPIFILLPPQPLSSLGNCVNVHDIN